MSDENNEIESSDEAERQSQMEAALAERRMLAAAILVEQRPLLEFLAGDE